ncbi:MAG: hypothetical protein Q8O52_10015 [Sulfuritalea sp.]|nr:hypothetical protein [Sulfuritalea sp.]
MLADDSATILLPEETMRPGKIPVNSGALTQEELGTNLSRQADATVGAGGTAKRVRGTPARG